MSEVRIPSSITTLLQMDVDGASRGTVLAVVAGELDISNSHILRARLLAAVRDRHPAFLDIDTAGVTFMDCSTVGALVSVHATSEKSGCRMRILNPRSIVVRLLGIADLLGQFAIVPAPEAPASAGQIRDPASGGPCA